MMAPAPSPLGAMVLRPTADMSRGGSSSQDAGPDAARAREDFLALLGRAQSAMQGVDGGNAPDSTDAGDLPQDAHAARLQQALRGLLADTEQALETAATGETGAILAGFADRLGRMLALFDAETGADTAGALVQGLPELAAADGVGPGDPLAVLAQIGATIGKALGLSLVPMRQAGQGPDLSGAGAMPPDTKPGVAGPVRTLLDHVLVAARTPKDAALPDAQSSRVGSVPQSAPEVLARLLAARGDALPDLAPDVPRATQAFAELLPAARVTFAPPDALQSQSAGSQPASPHSAPPRLADAIASQIRAASITEGLTRIELRPHGLGTIEIDLRTDADGSLRMTLRIDNPVVLDAMRADRTALNELMSARGLSLQGQGLSFEHSGNQRGSEERSSPGHAGAAPASPPDDTRDLSQTITGQRLDILT